MSKMFESKYLGESGIVIPGLESPDGKQEDIVLYPGLQPKQMAFMRLNAKYGLIGGSKGGGKSHACRAKSVATAVMFPGSRGLYLRKTFPEIRENAIDPMRTEIPAHLYEYHSTDHIMKFWNGSTIRFASCEHEGDVFKYQGLEYEYEVFEEITQWEEKQIRLLANCLRTRIPNLRPFMMGSCNPGGIGHCVPYGEVLTRSGWKEIKDVQIGEEVATLDDNEKMIFVPVSQKIQEKNHSELFDFTNATGRVICTQEHKIARRTETKTKSGRKFHGITLMEAGKLSKITRYIRSAKEWKGEEILSFSPPMTLTRKLKNDQPTAISGDSYCALMGWFLSEGYTVDRDKAFGIAQTKTQHRVTIKKLLDECRFTFSESSTGFLIYSPAWYQHFKKFGKCRDKFVPSEIKNTTTRQLKIFCNAIFAGDGHKTQYYTISRGLADDMQEIGLRIGKSPRIVSRKRMNREGLSYDVNFRDGRDGYLDRDLSKKTRFTGKVYCLGIEKYHRFFLRQDGCVWLSGNSWVKRLFINRDFKKNENPDDYGMVKANVYDNPWLIAHNPDYLQNLQNLDDTYRKAYLEGNWDVFEGQYFTEFDREIHVCAPHVPLIGVKRRIIGIDYGYSPSPSSVLWIALMTDGTVDVYRELYEKELRYDQLAMRIQAMTTERERLEIAIADPSVVEKPSEKLNTFSAAFKAEGLKVFPGKNDRIEGWNVVRKLLASRIDPNTGRKCAGMRIGENCRNLIRTLPEQIHDERNVEDLNTKGEDHLLDALRYACLEISDGSGSLSDVAAVNDSLERHASADKPAFLSGPAAVDAAEDMKGWGSTSNILNEEF